MYVQRSLLEAAQRWSDIGRRDRRWPRTHVPDTIEIFISLFLALQVSSPHELLMDGVQSPDDTSKQIGTHSLISGDHRRLSFSFPLSVIAISSRMVKRRREPRDGFFCTGRKLSCTYEITVGCRLQ